MDNHGAFPSMVRRRCFSENERSPPANLIVLEMTVGSANYIQPIDNPTYRQYCPELN
jgi:hypothetical protein